MNAAELFSGWCRPFYTREMEISDTNVFEIILFYGGCNSEEDATVDDENDGEMIKRRRRRVDVQVSFTAVGSIFILVTSRFIQYVNCCTNCLPKEDEESRNSSPSVKYLESSGHVPQSRRKYVLAGGM